MPYGIPRTEEERANRHRSIYGPGSEPPPNRKRMNFELVVPSPGEIIEKVKGDVDKAMSCLFGRCNR